MTALHTNGARLWTDAEDKIIRLMAPEYSAAQIARSLDRTTDAVKNRCRAKRVSLKKRGERAESAKYSNAITEWARQLHDDGVRPKVISEVLRIPYWSVHSMVYYKRGVV